METVEAEVERFASLFDFSQRMLGCVSVPLTAHGPFSAGRWPSAGPEALLSQGLALWCPTEPRWVSASTQPDPACSLLTPRLCPARDHSSACAEHIWGAGGGEYFPGCLCMY